jgi:hypothetical protein
VVPFVVLALVPAAMVAATGMPLELGAQAYTPATRGESFQLRPRPDACRRVVVIGDSLMDNAAPWLRSELQAAGFVSLVDAQHSRRIPATIRAPYSGVTAARAARATWGEADCWVVALGSNDIIFGGATIADTLIDEMIRAVTPMSRVWWVNLNYHHDPRAGVNLPLATSVFNAALDRRAATDPLVDVIDWFSYSEANLHWFFDPVHVDRTGSIARAVQTVSAIPRASG